VNRTRWLLCILLAGWLSLSLPDSLPGQQPNRDPGEDLEPEEAALPDFGEAGLSEPIPIDEAGAPIVEPTEGAEITSATLELLRELETFHREIDTIHVTFDQVRIDPIFEDRIESQGELWFDKPDRFRANYADPRPMTVMVVDDTYYQYVPELEQVEYLTFESEADRNASLHWLLIGFGLKVDELAQRYAIRSSADDPALRTELGLEAAESKALFAVRPRPAFEEATPFRELKVTIDKDRMLPEKVWYVDYNDAEMNVTMREIELDQRLDEDLFDVRKAIPRGTTHIDMRSMQ